MSTDEKEERSTSKNTPATFPSRVDVAPGCQVGNHVIPRQLELIDPEDSYSRFKEEVPTKSSP